MSGELLNAVKCAGPDCVVCGGAPKTASVPGLSTAKLAPGSYVNPPTLPPAQSPMDLKIQEVLAKRIVDLCREYGVTGMSGFAAQAVAAELIESEKKSTPFKKAAESFKSLGNGAKVIAESFSALQYEIASTGVMYTQSTHSLTAVETTINTYSEKLEVVLYVNQSKPLYLWESEAAKALQEVAEKKALILVTRAHLVSAGVGGTIKAVAWAIPLIKHLGLSSKPENYGPLGDWKKFGLKKLIGPEVGPKPAVDWEVNNPL